MTVAVRPPHHHRALLRAGVVGIAVALELESRLIDAEILEHDFGLRPARPTVRVEESFTGPSRARMLHN